MFRLLAFTSLFGFAAIVSAGPVDQIQKSDPPQKAPICATYKSAGKQEFSLSELRCVEFPSGLEGATLAVWDSDLHQVCDFRGSIVSLDGEGRLDISSNYASSTGFTGTEVQISSSNVCPFIKMRVY